MGFLKRVSEDLAFPQPHWDQEKQQKEDQPRPWVSFETMTEAEKRHAGLSGSFACAPRRTTNPRSCAIKQHNPAGWETRRYLNHETGKQLKRNCVTARWGGEHREENPIDRNASEHDSASNVDEPASEGRSPRSVSASSAGQRDGRSLAWWTIRRAGCGWWQ